MLSIPSKPQFIMILCAFLAIHLLLVTDWQSKFYKLNFEGKIRLILDNLYFERRVM